MIEMPHQYYFKGVQTPNGEVFTIQPTPKPIYAEHVTQTTRKCWAQARNTELSYAPTIGGLTLPEVLQQSGFEVDKDGNVMPIVWDLLARLRYSPNYRTRAAYEAPWKYVDQPWLPEPKRKITSPLSGFAPTVPSFIDSLNLEDI